MAGDACSWCRGCNGRENENSQFGGKDPHRCLGGGSNKHCKPVAAMFLLSV